MLDYLKVHLGAWVWYTLKDPDPVFHEYERLRVSLYLLNIAILLLLMLPFALSWRREWFKRFSSLARNRIIPILFCGLCLWVFEYAVWLSYYPPEEQLQLSFPKYAITLSGAAVGFCVFLVGWHLLRLGESRLHEDLRPPNKEAGISLPKLSRRLGSGPALVSYAVLVTLGVWADLQWPKQPLASLPSDLAGCAAHVAFGLGLLRELNRERREWVGCLAAVLMIAYGPVQITTVWPQLFFIGFPLAAGMKVALLVTLLAFGVMVDNSRRARLEGELEEQRRAEGRLRESERLIAGLLKNIGKSVTHPKLIPPITALKTVARLFERKGVDGSEELARSVSEIEEFLEPLTRPEQSQTDLQALLKSFKIECELRLTTTCSGPFTVRSHEFLIRRAIKHLLENAEKAGASLVSIEMGREASRVWLRIANDGDKIPADARLFGDGRGTGIAENFIKYIGGEIRLEPDERWTVFFISLPAAVCVEAAAAPGGA